jgi:hypothetical protein
MRLAILAVPLAASLIFAGSAYCASSCARECSADYRADVWTCQAIGADDSAGNNGACVQEAGDDYDTCVRDCADPLSLAR